MNKNIIYYFLLAFILYSCDRLFIDDISEVKIQLNSPNDDQTFTTADIDFNWDEVDEAEYYNLIIVSPDFNSDYEVIGDTNVTEQSFSAIFLPGDYQWYICAVNYHSMACSDTFSFTVDSSGSVINSKPTIIQPKSVYHNVNTIEFEWSKITSAEKYRFEIKENSWENTELLVAFDTENNIVEIDMEEGIFFWGVQSKYENLFSGFAFQEIIIDTTAPTEPVLSAPEDESSLSSTSVSMSWSHETSGIAAVFDSVFISTNENFTGDVLSEKSENKELTVDLEKGTYYWYVRSYDLAGNISDISEIYSFTVNG